MNKEQIFEAVGQEYTKWFYDNAVPSVSGKPILNGEGVLTRGEFINKCKTDSEFSERWGLKIEERELSLEERRALVTQEMFNEIYTGGDPSTLSHSEIDQWGVPRVADREPYTLPKLVINSGNANWHLLELDEIINTLDPDITFKVEGYKSHPSIKAPLSN